MTRKLSLLISWGCNLLLIAFLLLAAFYLVNIDAFAALVRQNIGLTINWSSVEGWQWYSMWFLTVVYMAIGMAGLYFLRQPFANFARGELFNFANSRNLYRFSMLLLAQAIAKPIHFSISSLVLSANHSAGNKMLSVSFGSVEIKMIALAIIFWVLSNLLIEGCKIQSENQQFV